LRPLPSFRSLQVDVVRNVRLHIQYDGSNYHGWQRQKAQRTVQGVIEDAIFKLTKVPSTLIGSGRTDAGVHAICQVANFETSSRIPLSGILRGLNSLLPHDICILHAEEAPPDFHARKHARKKLYSYVIIESDIRLSLLHKRAWIVRPPLDKDDMERACSMLIGTYDFKGFQKSGGSQKATTRTIFECKILETRASHRFLEIQVAANGFLRYMVRNIVGLLVEIGRKKRRAEDIEVVLASGIRPFHWQTAPPYGLYLKKVFY